jgi:hypothetical protein
MSLVVGVTALLSAGGADANHAGGMDEMALDFDTTGNAPTSIGTREPCALMSANGVMDLDEDGPDGILVDVTALNIPTTNRMIAFGARIDYDEDALTIEAADFDWLLKSNPGSSVLNASQPTPDMNGDFSWTMSAADAGSGQAEAGSGVLAELYISAEPGATPGAYQLTLNDAAHVNPQNQPAVPDALVGGVVAIDVPCPGVAQEADASVVSAGLTAPATGQPGVPFTVDGSVVLHNAGPSGPVNVDLSVGLSVPQGCSVAEPTSLNIQDVSLDMSTNVTVTGAPLSWTATCNVADGVQFTLTGNLTLDTPGTTDPSSANNTGTGQTVVAVNAVADVEVVSLAITAPANKTVGTGFNIGVSAVLQNNGPYGPVSADGQFFLTAPASCTILPPAGARSVFDVQLTSSPTTVPPEDGWIVVCSQPGTYTFTANTSFHLDQDNVTDSNTSNEAASAQASVVLKVGACGPDPDPDGTALQNPSPLLVSLIQSLTDDGSAVPPEHQTPIDCSFDANIYDPVGAQIDDCKVGLLVEEPCTLELNIGLHDPAGEPEGVPTVRLLPVSVLFLDSKFDIAPNAEIPDGTVAGDVKFAIRTDGGLTANGTPCIVDAEFTPATIAYEGAILPAGPDSNLSPDIFNPMVWPNDLNGEKAAIEAALQVSPGPAWGTLHSRMTTRLFSPGTGAKLAYNILIWHIDDPTIATAFGGEWVAVGLPGDAINPDPPGPMGGNPDADDPATFPISTCAPHSVNIKMSGTAGSSVYVACTVPAEPVIWDLLDPDAVNFTGDQGPRSDASTCSLDTDNDGLTDTEETHFGTNANNPDTDADGVQDGPDNCPATANASQDDFDGDDVGDICDADIDGDTVSNASDLCPGTVPAAAADSNGCSDAQVDLDSDGACNPGAPSGGPAPCTGSDNCPATANPGQENLDGDSAGDACDVDDDNDGVTDGTEGACGGDSLNGAERPERVDGVYAGVDDDGDTQVDEGLPPGAGLFDCDGDGYTGVTELAVFTAGRDQDPCGMDAWASDFTTGGTPDSTDRITITDVTSFMAPVRRLDTSQPDGDYSPRWDLIPDAGTFSTDIAIDDLTALIAGASGFPPMFLGERAFDGPACAP